MDTPNASHKIEMIVTQKCWNCGKVMKGDLLVNQHFECECGYHSCGSCHLDHMRGAHPSKYMEKYMPVLKQDRIENRAKSKLHIVYSCENVIPMGTLK